MIAIFLMQLYWVTPVYTDAPLNCGALVCEAANAEA